VLYRLAGVGKAIAEKVPLILTPVVAFSGGYNAVAAEQ
jgi:hypothetical protein